MTVCSRPQKPLQAIRGQLLCMPIEVPRWAWRDPSPRSHLKDGFRWRPPCLVLLTNRLCGPVLDSAQLQAQPSTSVLPPSLSEKETLLMLSCWQQWDTTAAPSSALSQWLVDIEVDYGPDGQLSPTYLKPSFNQRQLISIKLPTCIPWKAWQRKAPTPRSSASWHSESSPMNTLEKPSRQFTFSRLQGTCQASSPMISGLRRSGGMVIPRLLQ